MEKRHHLDYLLINTNNYTFKTWEEYFPDGQVKLDSLCINEDWNEFFVIAKKYQPDVEEKLTKYLVKKRQIVPYPELIFNSLNVLSPKKIKVVILGQDPYINKEQFNGIDIPQAMGFSFSVPYGYPACPPSLYNIYSNLLDFKHLKERPKEGCLMGWAMQGCLMINSSLTTLLKLSNAHSTIWPKFTKHLLKYINEECKNVVFLAWGKPAHGLCANIDHKQHKVIYSSHPSPFSCANTVGGWINCASVTHPSFKETDHFGQANEYLISVKKSPILWDVIDI